MKISDTPNPEDYSPPIILRVPSLEKAEQEIVGLYRNNFRKYGIIPPKPRELENNLLIGRLRM